MDRATASSRLADWILQNAGEVSHLKLQKLLFYTYGITRALLGCRADELGDIAFEPWEHGPVNRETWSRFRNYGSSPITERTDPSKYSPKVTPVLEQVLSVYGKLDAWSLREQSHLEYPWIKSYEEKAQAIDPVLIESHFRSLYGCGKVSPPAYLIDTGSFSIDGIGFHPREFSSLEELVEHIDCKH